MSDILRLTTVGVGILLVLVLGAGILVAGTVVATGVVSVRVQESGPDGLDLYLPVPAALVETTISLAPVVARLASDDFDREMDRLRIEIGPWMGAVASVLDELGRLPDATLVEVEGPGEHVVVRKRGRSLHVLVDEPGGRVSVVVPVRLVQRLHHLLDV